MELAANGLVRLGAAGSKRRATTGRSHVGHSRQPAKADKSAVPANKASLRRGCLDGKAEVAVHRKALILAIFDETLKSLYRLGPGNPQRQSGLPKSRVLHNRDEWSVARGLPVVVRVAEVS